MTTNLHIHVRAEADLLRVYATAEERGRLDVAKLQPDYIEKCIYGLMTGSCYSERASTLIFQCSDGVYTDSIQRYVKPEEWLSQFDYRPGFSAIEFYICQPGAKNAGLIAYIKGETEALEL